MVKNLWSSHPMQQRDEPIPATQIPVKPPEEGIPTKTNVSDENKYGRTSCGRSKRDQGRSIDYKCRLGDKQVPPGVRHLAPKRKRDGQKMSERRRMGDEMILRAKVDVPSVESLMASLL